MPKRGLSASDYLDPPLPSGLDVRPVRIIEASSPEASNLAVVVEGDPSAFDVPIVPWPISGSRPLDPGTGVDGGIAEGRFTTEWIDGRLICRNEAVGGQYVIGFAADDGDFPAAVDLWHLNYHPDGGQLFASVDGEPFVVPVAPAGDDPDLESAVGLYSDGSVAICVLPSVWHEGAYPTAGNASFLSRQGRIHARISADLANEFGVLLRLRLHEPP